MTQTMVYPFPIRKDHLAWINVPRDLTKEEAERLCEFVRSLEQPAGVSPTPTRLSLEQAQEQGCFDAAGVDVPQPGQEN